MINNICCSWIVMKEKGVAGVAQEKVAGTLSRSGGIRAIRQRSKFAKNRIQVINQ